MTDAQDRKRVRAESFLGKAVRTLAEADDNNLSRYAKSELVGAAANHARHAANTLDELAFSHRQP